MIPLNLYNNDKIDKEINGGRKLGNFF